MWIAREVYDDLRLQLAQQRGENVVLNQHQSAAQSTLDWLMLRVTQLEKERAVLLERVCGVVIETPVITRQPVSPIPQNVPVDALPIFDDMGDDAAQKQGIGWGADGTVKYGM